MVQGKITKITEAHTPTIKLGATPSGLISDPPAYHWVCKPAHLVLVPSQDKVGGLRQEGYPVKKWGTDAGGSMISPDGVAPSLMVGVCVPLLSLLSSLAP